MRHAGSEALARIESLLATLRHEPRLKERGTGLFYARGKAFLHFHEDPAGIFADLKRDGDWVRYPVNTEAERRRLVREIGSVLAAG